MGDAGQQQSVKITKGEIDSCAALTLTGLQKNVYATCLFPAESEDLDHREAARAQLCGWTRGVALIEAAQWSFSKKRTVALVSPQGFILA